MPYLYQCDQMNSNIGTNAPRNLGWRKIPCMISPSSPLKLLSIQHDQCAAHNLRQHIHFAFSPPQSPESRVALGLAAARHPDRAFLCVTSQPQYTAAVLHHPPEKAFPPCVACMTPPGLLLAEPSALPHWLSGPLLPSLGDPAHAARGGKGPILGR